MGSGAGNIRLHHAIVARTFGNFWPLGFFNQKSDFLYFILGPYLGAVWPGLWLSEGGISAFGFALVQALRMHPHFVRIAPDEDKALAILERLAGQPCAASTRHSPELHISPEFLGNRSPHSDPSATAAFVGVRSEGDEEGLVQWFLAVLASLCYGIREIMGKCKCLL